jgi:hypothetical protein
VIDSVAGDHEDGVAEDQWRAHGELTGEDAEPPDKVEGPQDPARAGAVAVDVGANDLGAVADVIDSLAVHARA